MGGVLQHKTLAVETGIMCNNRCVFCYQKGYRSIRGFPQMLPLHAIMSRLEWGLENGYDELSLTGGEPTARPDFLEIVSSARKMGYRRVAVTTNGWKLSRQDFFRDAVEAGLTSMGVSIHGIDAATHEALTGHAGSFRRAVQAVRNAVRTAGSYRHVRLNTFTLVNRLNQARLVDLSDMLFGIGVRLMIFQPVILSKSNFEDAADLAVGLSDVVQAVRSVAENGLAKGFRTKLFNLPPCLFRDVLRGMDIEHYSRSTFREHDDSSPGSQSLGDEAGFVRLPACARCLFAGSCSGVHVTMLPQEDLVAQVEASIIGSTASDRRPIWLGGTDLLRPAAMFRAVRKARLEGFSDVRVTFGGSGLGGLASLRAAVEAGASELVLVHRARDPGSSDRILGHSGNDRFLKRTARYVFELPDPAAVRVGLLLTPDPATLEFLNSPEIASLGRLSPTLHLRAPWRSTGSPDYPDSLGSFLEGLGGLPFVSGDVVMEVPEPDLLEALVLLPRAAYAARGRTRFDLSGFVPGTVLLDPLYSVLNWSDPFLYGYDAHGARPARRFYSRSISARPIDKALIQALQTPYGVQQGP